MWSKTYSNCMLPMPKAYSSKKYQKFYGIIAQNWVVLIKKYEKWKQNEKLSIIVSPLVKSHICSFLLVRWVTWLHTICVWLNWIDHWSLILDYGLIHTWYLHTTHKPNVQWISISFVWLHVFKCDVCMLNCLMIKPKKIFEYFICFWKWFLSLWSWKFFSKCQILCVEKLYVWPFCDCFREWSQVVKFLRNFNFLKILGREFRKSFVSGSRLRLDSWKSAFCICIFHK